MRIQRLIAVCTSMVVGVLALTGPAGGTQLAIDPLLDMQGQGLSIAEGGVGLEDLGAGTRDLNVTVGGPVKRALLYWAGRQFAECSQGDCFKAPNTPPFADQELTFDGTPLTGSIVGTEDEATGTIAYAADVTSIVASKGTGSHTFAISDADLSNNLSRLSGAGLIVLYSDASDSNLYRVMIADGLDYAFGRTNAIQPFPENAVTSPVNFNYQSSSVPRTAQLLVFVGDAEENRADRIDVSDNPSLVNQLDGSDGESWDTDTFPIAIPASTTQTTVQLFSAPPTAPPPPDSLLWVLTAIRVPLPAAAQGCSPGYWKNHRPAWSGTGFTPGQTVGSVFAVPGALSSLDGKSMHEALGFGGGPGVLGGGKILLRASVAALLNAGHPSVHYPQTVDEVTAAVDSALASNNRSTMLALATQLDTNNNLGCPLN